MVDDYGRQEASGPMVVIAAAVGALAIGPVIGYKYFFSLLVQLFGGFAFVGGLIGLVVAGVIVFAGFKTLGGWILQKTEDDMLYMLRVLYLSVSLFLLIKEFQGSLYDFVFGVAPWWAGGLRG